MEKQTDSGQDTKRNGKKQENQCGGLMLAGCQVPTKAVLFLPSSAGQGRGNTTKVSTKDFNQMIQQKMS